MPVNWERERATRAAIEAAEELPKFYLKHEYMGSIREGRGHEYIGPFEDKDEAVEHRADFGPRTALIVSFKYEPDDGADVFSPEDHIEYISKRT